MQSSGPHQATRSGRSASWTACRAPSPTRTGASSRCAGPQLHTPPQGQEAAPVPVPRDSPARFCVPPQPLRRPAQFLAKAVTTTLEKNARASSRRQSAESAPPSAQSLAPATFSNPPSLAGSSSAPHYAFGGPRSSQSHGNGAVSPYVPQSSSSAEHTGGTADRADRGPSGGGRKPSSMGTSASWRELPMSDLGEMAMPGQPVSKPKLDGSSERLVRRKRHDLEPAPRAGREDEL